MLLSHYNRRPAARWALVALSLLFMSPGFFAGEWHCRDGRVCKSCTFDAEGGRHCEDDHCSGPSAQALSNECRECCQFISSEVHALACLKRSPYPLYPVFS